MLLLGLVLQAYGQGNQLNQRDELGRRQGNWQGNFPNGRIRYQGQFYNDKPIGTFRYFHAEGWQRVELIHTLETDTVIARYFYPNRQIMAQGQFLNNQRAGRWSFFSERSVKVAERHFINGLANGISVTYFSNGAIAETVEYYNGAKHGEWNQYFENGSAKLNANYKYDKLNGHFRLFYQNGNTQLEAFYNQNLPGNTWKFYTLQGELQKEVIYKNGIVEKETIYIEPESEITIPVQPTGNHGSDVFRFPL